MPKKKRAQTYKRKARRLGVSLKSELTYGFKMIAYMKRVAKSLPAMINKDTNLPTDHYENIVGFYNQKGALGIDEYVEMIKEIALEGAALLGSIAKTMQDGGKSEHTGGISDDSGGPVRQEEAEEVDKLEG